VLPSFNFLSFLENQPDFSNLTINYKSNLNTGQIDLKNEFKLFENHIAEFKWLNISLNEQVTLSQQLKSKRNSLFK